MSALSYFRSKAAPMVTTLEASPSTSGTVLVSSAGLKAVAGLEISFAVVGISAGSSSFWACCSSYAPRTDSAKAASPCSQASALSKSQLTVMIPFGPAIFNLP